MPNENRILVIGAGLQGKAAITELCGINDVTLCVADLQRETVDRCLNSIDTEGSKIDTCEVDASNEESIRETIRESRTDIVVFLGPAAFGMPVAKTCVNASVHYVSASYPPEGIQTLDDEAKRKEITLLSEMGLDPGIDIVLALKALEKFKSVKTFNSFGSGIAADPELNPLGWMETWGFPMVLGAYDRDGAVIRGGNIVEVPSSEQFTPNETFTTDFNGSEMDAYVNGDVRPYIGKFGLDASQLETMGRYALRWPGHNKLWNALKTTGFLDVEKEYQIQGDEFVPRKVTEAIIARANADDSFSESVQARLKSLNFFSETPIEYHNTTITARQFLIELLTPQVQPSPEKPHDDLALLRVEIEGTGLNNQPHSTIIDFTAQGDKDFFAMNNTVGGTAALAAQMIIDGRITRRGVLSPACKGDVPADDLIREWESRGMKIEIREN